VGREGETERSTRAKVSAEACLRKARQPRDCTANVHGVVLGRAFGLVRLLDEELVALLLAEVDRLLLGVELEVGALHVIGTGVGDESQ